MTMLPGMGLDARPVVGLLAGFASFGVILLLGRLGRSIDVDLPVDPSAILLLGAQGVVCWLAGAVERGRRAVERGRPAVAAVAAGAGIAPLVGIAVMGGGCAAAGFVAIGLVMFAVAGTVIGGAAATFGDRWATRHWAAGPPPAAMVLLALFVLAGLIGLLAIAPTIACG